MLKGLNNLEIEARSLAVARRIQHIHNSCVISYLFYLLTLANRKKGKLGPAKNKKAASDF